MQKRLTAAFDSVDEAERAITRLKQVIPDYSVELSGAYIGSTPAEAPYSATLYYPYRPINVQFGETLGMPYQAGGRVLLTSEIMGLPVYRNEPTELQLTLGDADAERARALLINQGAHRTRLD